MLCAYKFKACSSLFEDPYDQHESNSDVLTIKGIWVGTVTSVHLSTAPIRHENERMRDFKLIKYKNSQAIRQGVPRGVEEPQDPRNQFNPESTILNTSWGPYGAVKGDVIIVANGCPLPLVLREFERGYLLVGGCILIVSSIKNLVNFQADDPGFSDLMRGSAWKELGSVYHLQEFNIH